MTSYPDKIFIYLNYFSIPAEYGIAIENSVPVCKTPTHETAQSDTSLPERGRRKDVQETELSPPKLETITTGLFLDTSARALDHLLLHGFSGNR